MPTHPIAFLAFALTWAGFLSAGRWYFRRARERTPAKTVLVVACLSVLAVQGAVIWLSPAVSAGWLWSGVVCFALAGTLFLWAIASHGKAHPAFAFIPVAPTTLTTAGPYSMIRHPIYSAYLLAFIGACVVCAQPLLLVTFAGMFLIYFRAASVEEQGFLNSDLADAYRAYRRHTGMFAPKLTGLLPGLSPRV